MKLAKMEQWAVLRNWSAQKHAEMLRFVSDTFVVINSNEALCRMWAEVRGQAKSAGRQIETADAWIAATALLHGAELVTHNAPDFDFLTGLTVITEA